VSASHLWKAGGTNLDPRQAIVLSARAQVFPPVAEAAPLPMPVRRPLPVTVDPLTHVVNDSVVGRIAIRGRKPLALTVIVDGVARQVSSTFRSSTQVLGAMGIALGPADRVVPAANTLLWSGARVRVIRIRREVAARQVLLPVPVIHRSDPTLPRGRVVVVPGRPGVKVQRFEHTFADRKLVALRYLDQRILRPSQPRVVRTGTRVMIAARGAFAGREFLDMVATAYAPWCCRGVDDVTAIGLKAGYGVVAVDPRIIPLRSRLYIEGYGYAVAGDTGSAIKGLRIDLGMDTTRLARQWGRRSVRVFIIQKAPPKKTPPAS
jgi:3D (Asp-Asp-Asp) domain-containing protein